MEVKKMQIEKIFKIRKTAKGNYSVTIPVEFLKALGWKEGSEVSVVLDTVEHAVIIKNAFHCIQCGKTVTLAEQIENGVVELDGKQGYLCNLCQTKLEI